MKNLNIDYLFAQEIKSLQSLNIDFQANDKTLIIEIDGEVIFSPDLAMGIHDADFI
jgi:hypothetical protein